MCKIDERCVPHGYFGVFDGHGGVEVSEYAADRLHDNVLASPYMAQLDAHAALQDGFLRTDAELLRRAEQPQRRKTADAGSAAVCMLATADTLTLAHAGDCRAILVRRSNAPGAPFVELTCDHSAELDKPLCDGGVPLRPDEADRVRRVGGDYCGGYVSVASDLHSLPMTRALGNLPLKVGSGRDWRRCPVAEQVVTALPDVSTRQRSADDLCVVLASDGLFGNVMTSEAVDGFDAPISLI